MTEQELKEIEDELKAFEGYPVESIRVTTKTATALVKKVRDYEQNSFFDGKPISEVRKILDMVYRCCGSDKADDFRNFMEVIFERLKQLKRGSDEV